MGEYVIFVHIPYEGMSEIFSGNENECVRWLKSDRHGYPLDDLEIYEHAKLDIYEMHGRAAW
jgi:hypothetical protein